MPEARKRFVVPSSILSSFPPAAAMLARGNGFHFSFRSCSIGSHCNQDIGELVGCWVLMSTGWYYQPQTLVINQLSTRLVTRPRYLPQHVMIYDDEIDTIKSKWYVYWNPNPKTAFTININYIVIGRASRIHIDDVITSYLAVIWSLVIIYVLVTLFITTVFHVIDDANI